MHQFLQLAYAVYVLGYGVYRWYRFVEKYREPKAGVTTLFSGHK